MLADILHKIAAETQPQNSKYAPRPSLAGPERCIRSLVYHANGTPASPFPGRAITVFDDSTWHAELVKDWIRKSAYQIHSEEMEVITPVGVGHIDGIITDLLGADRVLELKALNHFSFERIWKGAWPLDYFAQCALYLVGVRKFNADIRECLLLVKNKNQSQYFEMLLSYDEPSDLLTLLKVVRSDGESFDPKIEFPGLVTGAVEKFSLVEQHRQAKTLPDRPFEYGTTFPCGYCRWATTCWQGYEQEFQQLATEQALDDELVNAAAYYCETRAHISDMEDEKEKAKQVILDSMKANGLRHGKTSQYALTLSLREKVSWDESQIPPDIVNRAKRKSPYVQLDVRKLKVKEATNGDGKAV